jgi:hypothetical protein
MNSKDGALRPRKWDIARDQIIDSTLDVVKSPGDIPRPSTLFHFTDTTGFIGVLGGHALWASHAQELNDSSEIAYGLAKAAEVLRNNQIQTTTLPCTDVVHFLDRKHSGSVLMEFDVFIVSFCARIDRAMHWLHYGRSGMGIAIGFDTSALQQNPFDLFPVLYDDREQETLLGRIVQRVDMNLTERLPSVDAAERPALVEVAARIAADFIWLISARFKNPAFSEEEEWRLITFSIKVDRGRIPGTLLPPHFRAVGGRIVPYVKVNYEALPVTAILLGASRPTQTEEAS